LEGNCTKIEGTELTELRRGLVSDGSFSLIGEKFTGENHTHIEENPKYKKYVKIQFALIAENFAFDE
jgi:hypothetical protein